MIKENKQDTPFAWLVLVAAFFSGFIEKALTRSPTVFIIEWHEYFDTDYTDVMAIYAMFDATVCLGAMIFAPLVLKYGCRRMAFIGAIVTSIGLLMSVFAFSVICLYVSFGLITGIGIAIFYICPLACVQYFFDKYRPLAVGVAVGGKSAGGFVSTPLIRLAVDTYGWRGAMLLLTGIAMQLMICAMFYRPFDLESIEKPLKPKSEKPLKDHEGKEDSSNIVETETTENGSEMKTFHFAEDNKKQEHIVKRFMKWINNKYNYKLFLEYDFSAFILGVTLLQFTTAAIPGIVPLKAVAEGRSKMQAAFLTSALDITTFCSILLTGCIANGDCINRTIMYGLVVCLYASMGILICFTWSYLSLFITIVLAGVFYGCDRALINTVMGDIAGIARITQAKAWDMGTSTIAFASALPLAGMLIDATGSYNIPLFTLCVLGVIGGAIILTIPVVEKMKKRHTES